MALPGPKGEWRDKVLALYGDNPPLTRFFLYLRWICTSFEMLAGLAPASGIVVDLGCGHGMLANLLALQEPGRLVFGCDIDERRIDSARATVKSRGNISFAVRDLSVEGVPVADCYYVTHTLHHMSVAAQRELMDRCADGLRPGGRLIIVETDTRPRWRHVLHLAHEYATGISAITASERVNFHAKEWWVDELRSRGLSVELHEGFPQKLYPFWIGLPSIAFVSVKAV